MRPSRQASLLVFTPPLSIGRLALPAFDVTPYLFRSAGRYYPPIVELWHPSITGMFSSVSCDLKSLSKCSLAAYKAIAAEDIRQEQNQSRETERFP